MKPDGRAPTSNAERQAQQDEELVRIETAFEHSPVGLLVTSLDGRVLSANDAFCRVLHRPREEVTGGVLPDLVGGGSEALTEALTEAREGRRPPSSFAFELAGDAGESRWLSCSIQTARPSVEGASFMVVALQDATEQVRSARELEFSKSLVERAQQLAKLGVAEWNTHTDEVVWSDVMYDIYGRAREAGPLSAAQIMEFMHEDDRDRVIRTTERVRKTGVPESIEYRVRNPDGRVTHVLSHGASMATVRDGQTWLTIVAQDVTEFKDTQAALAESEKWLQTTLESIGDAVIATDRHGRVRFMNPVASELTGWSAEEALQRPLSEVLQIHDETTGRVAVSPVSAVLERNETVSLSNHVVLTSRNGSRRPIADSAAPIRSADGRPVGMVLVFRDQTREREVQEQLRYQAERADAIFESMMEGVITSDAKGRIVSANRAAAELLGYDRHELVGMDVAAFAPSPHRERQLSYIEEYERTGTSTIVGTGREIDAVRRDGKVIPVYASVAKLTLGDEESFAVVLQDLSHQKEIAAGMMRMDRLLAAGTLAAGVGHEINNPLTYVSSSIEMCQNAVENLRQHLTHPSQSRSSGELLDELAGNLAVALDGCDRIAQTVRQLRTLSRGDDASDQVIDLGEAIEIAINMTANEIRHHAELERDVGPALWVRGNRARLIQVFVNLLTNAAQATIGDGDQRITLRARRAGDRVVASVSDTGPGISDAVMKRIFDPFFTTKSVGRGTGLGLAITQKTLTEHNGGIRVESREGEGTTFTVELPWAGAPPTSVAPDPEPAPPPKTRARILIVDDEVMLGRGMQHLLAAHYDCEHVASTAEAVARLESGPPYALVICDLMLPDRSGMELWREVEERRLHAQGAWLFTTGGAFIEEAQQFLDRPGIEVLHKPFRRAQLLDAVAKRLGAAEDQPS